MKERLYISGPMTGHAHFNAPAFDEAERLLRDKGYTPVSPLQKERDAGVIFEGCTGKESLIEMGIQLTMQEIIMQDTEMLLECTGIFMLNEWETSKGATAEYAIARWAGLSARFQINSTNWVYFMPQVIGGFDERI